MPNTKISNLTNAATLTGTEVAPIVQSGSTVKATAQNIANLAIPSQTGQSGKFLTTNGTTTSWGTAGAGFTFVSWNFSFGGGGLFANNQLANNTGMGYTLSVISNYIQVQAFASIFTTNKVFVSCQNIRFNTPSIAYFGGVEFTNSMELRVLFYDASGNAFTTFSASQPRTCLLNIQIYP